MMIAQINLTRCVDFDHRNLILVRYKLKKILLFARGWSAWKYSCTCYNCKLSDLIQYIPDFGLNVKNQYVCRKNGHTVYLINT